uniref:Predicted acyl esterases n=1 Tax=uncultured Rhodospirillales bacterium HF0500_02H05 TaxID=723610 RepID=E7C4R1_9PROT|nr:predicted acyl esterases [uncultured Rhodospirillales bacterium HF0500_02H05]
MGRPVLHIDLECDADWSNLCARLVDVHPDGTATRVSFGVLNLAHRDLDANYADPQAMPRGKKVAIELVLDACGYRFKPGHRIRLALSTSYWPMILPPPFDAGLTIAPSSIRFDLPLLGDHDKIIVKEPENPDPLPTYIEHKPSRTERSVHHNLTQNETRYRIYEDTGLFEHPDSRLATRQVRSETWTINPLDPNSMRGEAAWTCDLQRDDWFVRTDCHAELSCDRDNWYVSAWVIAYEGTDQIFEKKWEKSIPRNFM